MSQYAFLSKRESWLCSLSPEEKWILSCASGIVIDCLKHVYILIVILSMEDFLLMALVKHVSPIWIKMHKMEHSRMEHWHFRSNIFFAFAYGGKQNKTQTIFANWFRCFNEIVSSCNVQENMWSTQTCLPLLSTGTECREQLSL